MDNDYEFVELLEDASKCMTVASFTGSIFMVGPEYEKRMIYSLKKVFKKLSAHINNGKLEEETALFILYLNNTHLILTRALIYINSLQDKKFEKAEDVLDNIESFSRQFRTAKELGWLDSREKYVLYNFNAFRNILTHSDPILILGMMPKEDRKAALSMMRETASAIAEFITYIQSLLTVRGKDVVKNKNSEAFPEIAAYRDRFNN